MLKNFYRKHEDEIERATYRHPVVSLVFIQIFVSLFLLGSMAAAAAVLGSVVWTLEQVLI